MYIYIYTYINQISQRSTKGWLQEMGSNEEQPLRRFAVWLGGSVRSALSAVVPVKAFRRRHKSLEDDENREKPGGFSVSSPKTCKTCG